MVCVRHFLVLWWSFARFLRDVCFFDPLQPRTAEVVRAKVPLANMFQYVSSLRSATKGRANYQMSLESYELVPPNVEKEIMAKYRGNTGEGED